MTNLIDVTADYLRVNDGVTFDTGARYIETTTGTPDFVTIEGPSTDSAFPTDASQTIVRWSWNVGTAQYKSLSTTGAALPGNPTNFNTTTNIKLTD